MNYHFKILIARLKQGKHIFPCLLSTSAICCLPQTICAETKGTVLTQCGLTPLTRYAAILPLNLKIQENLWFYYLITGAVILAILVYRNMLREVLKEKEKTQESLQAFFDNKLVGMVELDTDGNYQQVNRQWEIMTGYSQDELLSMNYLDLTHPKDINQKMLFEQLSERNGERVLQATKRYIRKDGSIFWGDISGTGLYNERNRFIGLVGMIADATERKQAEEERERLLRAIDQSSEVIVITDCEGTIQYANPAFETISGYTCKEALGLNPRILQSGRHNADFYQEMWDILLQGETWSGQFINKKKDGSLYTEKASISPVCDASNQIVNYVAVKRDISEEIKAEEQRLELENQLHQKYKMEAIGEMTGGMAHNFNNNLAIILGNIELSQLKLPRNSAAISNLNMAKTAILHSRDLIQQILTYSRQGKHDKTPVSLPHIIDETVKLLRSTIPSTVKLKRVTSNDSNKATINADSSRIQEALINLCNNAVQAMNEKGDLTISLEVIKLSPEDIPGSRTDSPESYAKLSVQDNGTGMSEEIKEKIFDLFFTTKDVNKGTGIGLSTVQGIVDQHDGFIKVKSTLGEGSTFHIYFPVVEKNYEERVQTTSSLPRGNEKVLYLDDDKQIAKVWSQVLGQYGYQVTTETSSSKFLARFKKNPLEFDLVITDQTMPELSGKDLVKELLANRPDLPTILCTGYSNKINEEEARELGIKAFCMKPLDLPKLIQTTRQVLDEARAKRP